MSMQKNNKMRAILSVCIGFVIAAMLTVMLCCVEIYIGMCSKGAISRSLNSCGYKGKAYVEFCEKSNKIFADSGIEVVMENVCTQEEAFIDYLNYEKSALKGKDKTRDIEELSLNIEKIVLDSVKKNISDNLLMVSNEELEQVVEQDSKEIAKLYIRYMQPRFVLELNNSIKAMRKYIYISFIIAIAIMVIFSILLLGMYKHKGKCKKFFIASMLGASLSNIIAIIIIFSKMKLSNMNIVSGVYEVFVEEYISEMKIPFYACVIIMLLSVALLMHLNVFKSEGVRRKKK